jgi:hypothetical protein
VSKGYRFSQCRAEIEDAVQDTLVFLIAEHGRLDRPVSHAVQFIRSRISTVRRSCWARTEREGQFARSMLEGEEIARLTSGRSAPARAPHEHYSVSWIDYAIGSLSFPLADLCRQPRGSNGTAEEEWQPEPVISIEDDEPDGFYAEQGLAGGYMELLEIES